MTARVEIPLKNRSRYQQDLSGLSGLGGFFGKNAKTAQILLKKPLKALKGCFKLGKKSRLGS